MCDVQAEKPPQCEKSAEGPELAFRKHQTFGSMPSKLKC